MRPDARKMVQGITAALNKAFPIPDMRVFIREYSSADVSQDGSLDTGGVKPSFSMHVPRLASMDIFVEEKNLENVDWGGKVQSDRPEAVQMLKPISQAA